MYKIKYIIALCILMGAKVAFAGALCNEASERILTPKHKQFDELSNLSASGKVSAATMSCAGYLLNEASIRVMDKCYADPEFSAIEKKQIKAQKDEYLKVRKPYRDNYAALSGRPAEECRDGYLDQFLGYSNDTKTVIGKRRDSKSLHSDNAKKVKRKTSASKSLLDSIDVEKHKEEKQIARETAEREVREARKTAEREARETAEREARETAEREAREAAKREERQIAEERRREENLEMWADTIRQVGENFQQINQQYQQQQEQIGPQQKREGNCQPPSCGAR